MPEHSSAFSFSQRCTQTIGKFSLFILLNMILLNKKFITKVFECKNILEYIYQRKED